MTVTDDSLKLFLDAARAQNEYVSKRAAYDRPRAEAAATPKGDRPGDHFNAREQWHDWLTKWGWIHMGGRFWKRPGKDAPGISATVGYCKGEAGNPLLFVFSTNAAPFEAETTYSLFAAYALVEHLGDYSAAAQALSDKGYGVVYAPITTFSRLPGTPADPLPATPPVVDGTKPARLFLETSELRRLEMKDQWIVHGYLSRGGITLFSAMPKVGKTTFVTHMFRALALGGSFCGLTVRPSRALMVSEESEHLWAERRDTIGLGDNIGWLCRPFGGRPSPLQWVEFLGKLKEQVTAYEFDVVVIDTLAKLWPVKDENDAVGVDNALMPLWPLTERAALLCVHHLRKSGGDEGTGSRGSGALTAFPETIVEMRRFSPTERKDRRRVLTGYGRYQETRDELVIQLATDFSGYAAVSDDPAAARKADDYQVIVTALPVTLPGVTTDQLLERCPMKKQKFLALLWECVEQGEAMFTGTGVRGDPYLFRRATME